MRAVEGSGVASAAFLNPRPEQTEMHRKKLLLHGQHNKKDKEPVAHSAVA